MSKEGYVAFDLGAESGRAMLATLHEERLELEEVHRFPNTPQRLPSGLHWDLTGLWGNLIEGLRKCGRVAKDKNVTLVSLGVDTWGVDFGLIGKSGQLLGLPYAYRDARNPKSMKKVVNKLGDRTIYQSTGIQSMFFNTLYQLAAQNEAEPKVVAQTKRLLLMPDLLHYFFSGKAVNEATIASTTQMMDPRKGRGKWAKPLLKKLWIPTDFLGPVVPAGKRIGKLQKAIADDAGVEQIDVIAPGCHDTASAVAAVPVDMASGKTWAYLSSGTWSLMGAELNKPLVTEAARVAGFTNERGVANKIRFLKNIAGLWLVQEVRRDYARRGMELDYATLTQMASQAEPWRTLIDPGHAPFSAPGEMCAKIILFAKKTQQPVPDEPGQYVRACLESLALAYRQTLERLEMLLDRRIDVLHIVGGGGRNTLLNQLTADAIGRPVIVGPYEATAIGNALTQAMGRGAIKDLAHLRTIVRNSFEVTTYQPNVDSIAPVERFASVLGN